MSLGRQLLAYFQSALLYVFTSDLLQDHPYIRARRMLAAFRGLHLPLSTLLVVHRHVCSEQEHLEQRFIGDSFGERSFAIVVINVKAGNRRQPVRNVKFQFTQLLRS